MIACGASRCQPAVCGQRGATWADRLRGLMPDVTPRDIANSQPTRQDRAGASRLQVIAGFAVIYIVWGSTYLAIAYAVRSLPPVLTTAARFVVAGLILCIYAWWRGAPRPVWTEWRAAAIAGALLVVGGTATVCWAEQWVPSGLTSLLCATVPLWFVLLEWMAPGGQRPHGLVAAGVVLGLIGLAVLNDPFSNTAADSRAVMGAGVLVLSSILWAVGSLYSRHAALPKSAVLGMGMEMTAGGLLCIPAGYLIGERANVDLARVPAAAWIALAFLTFVGCLVAFTTYMWLLRVSVPSRVATHAYVNPVVAVVLGWAVAGEALTARMLVAACLVIGAVVLITSGQQPVTIGDASHPGLPTEAS
jgi:drug/metabolite transporter (DMT)-like permease